MGICPQDVWTGVNHMNTGDGKDYAELDVR
jgi:hypothetical protein